MQPSYVLCNRFVFDISFHNSKLLGSYRPGHLTTECPRSCHKETGPQKPNIGLASVLASVCQPTAAGSCSSSGESASLFFFILLRLLEHRSKKENPSSMNTLARASLLFSDVFIRVALPHPTLDDDLSRDAFVAMLSRLPNLSMFLMFETSNTVVESRLALFGIFPRIRDIAAAYAQCLSRT